MALPLKPEYIAMNEAEYLQTELTSSVKHEYHNGQVYAMTGASNNHTRLTGNIARKFGNHLEGKPCEVFMLDTKVKVGESYFYGCVANFTESQEMPVLEAKLSC